MEVSGEGGGDVGGTDERTGSPTSACVEKGVGADDDGATAGGDGDDMKEGEGETEGNVGKSLTDKAGGEEEAEGNVKEEQVVKGENDGSSATVE